MRRFYAARLSSLRIGWLDVLDFCAGDSRWTGNVRCIPRSVALKPSTKPTIMKSSTNDRIEGTGKEVKGAAKQEYGKLTGDTSKRVEGTVDRVEGKVQKAGAEIKKQAGH